MAVEEAKLRKPNSGNQGLEIKLRKVGVANVELFNFLVRVTLG